VSTGKVTFINTLFTWRLLLVNYLFMLYLMTLPVAQIIAPNGRMFSE
jgi:hypothetical protein